MPGLIVFHRRWSVGSDDLVVPGVFLFTIHLIWLIILTIVICAFNFDISIHSIELLWYYKLGYILILLVSTVIELAICIISMRGSILDTSPRVSMKYWLYIRLVMMFVDISWLVLGIIWLKKFYTSCPLNEPKEIMLASVICNWLVVLSIIITIWCTFDPAGRSWVKMKKYQRSMRESETRFNYKRSGSRNRNWRQRKVIRAYQDSWDHRCRLLFCCMGSSDRSRNSFTDIARLLSDFFRDLDVVPSDVVAGLVLLRKFQKLEREAIVRQGKNGTYEFLSGVPITQRTQFLALNDTQDYEHFQSVIHFMYFAQGAYGWPMYVMTHSTTGICQLCSELKCCWSCCRRKADSAEIIKDNCCFCNYAALKKMVSLGEVEVVYATFHVDIGETPFFVAVDYSRSKIIVSIRGTLSMQDVLTDLNAEGECLPLNPPREDWIGHKGMVQAAVYIKNKLDEENLIQRALNHNTERQTQKFGIVLVGHSLGAGTAAILAILLKQEYSDLHCYSYSPPGGLLSMPAVEYSKKFITSVVVGKDVVPRIGLHQMETLRADLINAIKRSVDPKWKTIACSVICCCCGPEPTSVTVMSTKDSNINAYKEQRHTARQSTCHPNDTSIAFSLHRPLYPPGRIIHIVRHHPGHEGQKYETGWRQMLKKNEPVYQAIWANNTDFDEVLISPVMVQDHMPDKVLAALNKVITTFGPRKPQRQSSNANSSITSELIDPSALAMPSLEPRASSPLSINNSSPSSHRICLETSFTSFRINKDYSNNEGCDIGNSSVGDGGNGSNSKYCSISERSFMNSTIPCDSTLLLNDNDMPTSSVSNGLCEIQNNTNNSRLIRSSLKYDLQKLQSIPLAGTNYNVTTANPMNASNLNSDNGKTLFRKKLSSQTMSLDERVVNFTHVKKLDLIHDDWFGLAPLASPESLSELSSISSRSGLTGNIIDSSLVHTPTVMRRAPKITNNLSKCADDWRLVDNYRKMEKFILNIPKVPFTSDVTDSINQLNDNNNELLVHNECSDNLIYDNVNNQNDAVINDTRIMSIDDYNKDLNISHSSSNNNNKFVNFEADNVYLNECAATSSKLSTNSIQVNQTPIIKYKLVNDKVLNDNQLNDFNLKCLPAKNVNFSNSDARITLDKKNRENYPITGFLPSLTTSLFSRAQPITLSSASSSSSSSSASISQCNLNKRSNKMEQFKINSSDRIRQYKEPEVYRINNSASGILESHFPVYEENSFLLPLNLQNTNSNNENSLNNKNESLPLLHKIDDNKSSSTVSSSSSPSIYYPRKKNYVYPMTQSVATMAPNKSLLSPSRTQQQSKKSLTKNESSV